MTFADIRAGALMPRLILAAPHDAVPRAAAAQRRRRGHTKCLGAISRTLSTNKRHDDDV